MFTPASPAQRAKRPSPIEKKYGDGQERRCSHRHRPHSGRNSHRQSRRSTGTARSAGVHTGIARAAGETPVANREKARGRPGAPVFTPASPAQRAKLPSPVEKKHGDGQERRCSHRHRPRSGRNSHRQSRRSTETARSAGVHTGIARAAGETPIANREEARGRLGAPVFTPASPAQRAKLPSPIEKKHGDGQERRCSHRHRPPAGETPIANREEARGRPGAPVFTPASPAQRAKRPSPIEKKYGDGQERRCSHRHRPRSGRNSDYRPFRIRATPSPASRPPPRSSPRFPGRARSPWERKRASSKGPTSARRGPWPVTPRPSRPGSGPPG